VKRDKSDYTNSHFPILHIIGLPGAGKTTLAKRLSGRLDLPIFQIGEYRSKPQSSPAGEADAWVALFKDLSRRRWRNCIFETTGLNRMESFLRVALPLSQIITIKLDASRKVLDLRIGKKRKREQGGQWLFSSDYPDKYVFVRKLYKEFKRLPSDIRIDTTNLSQEKVYQNILKKLEIYMRTPF
jgi:adenylate kinase family enzyme